MPKKSTPFIFEDVKKKFFNNLADILEQQFPKEKCQERSQALCLNAMANVFLDEALAQQREHIGRQFADWFKKTDYESGEDAILRITNIKV